MCVLFIGQGAGYSCLRAQGDNNTLSLLGSIITHPLVGKNLARNTKAKCVASVLQTFVSQLCSSDLILMFELVKYLLVIVIHRGTSREEKAFFVPLSLIKLSNDFYPCLWCCSRDGNVCLLTTLVQTETS